MAKKKKVYEQAVEEQQAAQAAQPAAAQPAPVAAPTQQGTADNDKKTKKKKKVLTPEQKKRRRKLGCGIVVAIFVAIVLVVGIFAIANYFSSKALIEQALNIEHVQYTKHAQLVPEKDEDGYYYFETDGDFNVLQITDVHIGAGVLSTQKDTWAMNAVATMVRQSQPDLVIITGDIGYPVPFSSGTFNNMNAAKVFANEMESLGVYWTFAFGNHDTEAYSYYSRKEICDWYAQQKFHYCLFEANNDFPDKDTAEDFGYGNNIIKVKSKTTHAVTQALVLFDSHSYTDGDVMGMLWKYDNIHRSQIDWYTSEMKKMQASNAIITGVNEPIKNLAFFHIPLREYRKAWSEYADNKYQDTADVQKIYGINGEELGATLNPFAETEPTYGVYCGVYKEDLDGLFWQAAKNYGMQGTFCGHDHKNNFSLNYTHDGYTMRLTYGMSIDYLAYSGIFKEHAYRGCTDIIVRPDGTFDCQQKNYYVDFDNVDTEAGDLSDITAE